MRKERKEPEKDAKFSCSEALRLPNQGAEIGYLEVSPPNKKIFASFALFPALFALSGKRSRCREASAGRGGCSGLGGGDRLGGRGGLVDRGGGVDELDDGHRGAVAAAGAELGDAGVAAGTALEALGELDEDLLDDVDL